MLSNASITPFSNTPARLDPQDINHKKTTPSSSCVISKLALQTHQSLNQFKKETLSIQKFHTLTPSTFPYIDFLISKLSCSYLKEKKKPRFSQEMDVDVNGKDSKRKKKDSRRGKTPFSFEFPQKSISTIHLLSSPTPLHKRQKLYDFFSTYSKGHNPFYIDLPLINSVERVCFESLWKKSSFSLIKLNQTLHEALNSSIENFIKRVQKEGDEFISKRFSITHASSTKGHGLFVKDPEGIQKNEIIGIYTGLLHQMNSDEYDKDTSYAFTFLSAPELQNWILDADFYGNYTSKINHANETECNAYPIEFFDASGPYILIVASRFMALEEEVCINYGKNYWKHTHVKPK